MGVQMLRDGLHEQVVMLGVDVDDAGVHHNADAELGVPQNRVGVVHKERAADDVNRRIDVVYLGCLLTARELAAATSFPENYVFCGGDTAAKKQIGNAVPPVLAEALYRAVLAA